MQSSTLLQDVKNYLDITWDDQATDCKLEKIIERGIDYLNMVAGKELDFTKQGLHTALLMDYCRYVRSNALEEFQRNFNSELNTLYLISGDDDEGTEEPDIQ